VSEKPKFTLGPLTVRPVHYLGKDLDTFEISDGVGPHWIGHTQKIEDAQLFAAAPDLYGALAAFMGIWGSGDSTSPSKRAQNRRAAMWAKANAAMAKARGEV
jgi:hypothetical protein